MQRDDFQRFRAVMAGMAKLYEREIDATLLDAYWLALIDWPLADFERAAGKLMATSKFMPRPADFTELRNSDRPTSGEAWSRVLAAVRTSTYPIGDPLVDAVAGACGGYRAIGQCTDEGLPFMERRFAEHFDAMSQRIEGRQAMGFDSAAKVSGPKSIGSVMGRLRLDAAAPNEPVTIGNRVAAK